MKGKFGFKGASKGKAKAAAPKVQTPEVLEFQFQTKANELFESLMDWNTKPQQLTSGWQQVIDLRTSCMKAYLAQETAAAGSKAAASAPAGGVGADEVVWKQVFNEEVQRRIKGPSGDSVQFETRQEVGATGQKEFISIVTCSCLKNQYEGEPAVSKKQAEHNAAKAAMEHEMSAAYHKAKGGSTPAAAAAAPQQGKKRKAEVLQVQQEPILDSKQRLAAALNLLLAGPLEKGALVYETAQAEDGSYVSTVTLQAYDPSVGYQGVGAANKKIAENNAAEAALDALKNTLAPLEEEAKTRKAAKKKDALDKLKAKTAETKAAKLAVKAEQ